MTILSVNIKIYSIGSNTMSPTNFSFLLIISIVSLGVVHARGQYAIKKLEPYSVNYENYCDLTVPVNASFIPRSIWYKIENGKKVILDINGNPLYYNICEACNKRSPCEYDHWRMCNYIFILRIRMKENERTGQYFGWFGMEDDAVNHTFTLIQRPIQERTTPAGSITNQEKEEEIVLTKFHVYIGIGVAIAVVFLFIVVFIAICCVAKSRKSENKRQNRHQRGSDSEPSVMSNFVSNHTYAEIPGAYDGLNQNLPTNVKHVYAVPIKNKNNNQINGGATNYPTPIRVKKDSGGYLQPNVRIQKDSVSADDDSFREPEPLAYQLIGINKAFPSGNAYDDSAFQMKMKSSPPVPEQQYANINNAVSYNNKIYK